MSEHPILFSADMVRAILDGSKTQTRRIIKPQPPDWRWNRHKWDDRCINVANHEGLGDYYVICLYGKPGNRLWVRETWKLADGCLYYKANGEPDQEDIDMQGGKWRWRPSIFLPRIFSRITLEIVNVRVERLHEIWTRTHTWDDCFAEGIPQSVEWEGDDGIPTPLSMFIELWNSINSKRGYDWITNPWVWVIDFKRIIP